MKNTFSLFSIFILVTIMLSCKSDETPSFLSVDPESIQVDYRKSSVIISISSSSSWTISSNQMWLTLSESSGVGNKQITIEVDANPLTDDRFAIITVQALDVLIPKNIEITQQGGLINLSVSRNSTTFAAPSSTKDTVRVISNTSWTLSSDQDWLVVEPVTGNGSLTIELTAESNLGLAKRQAVITVATTDLTLSEIIFVTQNPRVSVLLGGNGIGSNINQLSAPSSVFVDGQGSVYVTDQHNNRVMKLMSNSLQPAVVAGGNGPGAALNQLNSPYGIFVDLNGDLFIGDNQNHRVVKWSAGSTTGVVVAGGNGFGSSLNQTSSPDGVYLDAGNNVFVSEAGNHRVSKWAQNASSGTLIAEGPSIAFTTAITLDNSGNVYIASGDNSNVTKWAPGSSVGVVVAGGNGRGENLNQLDAPSGVYVDELGNLYISDQGNNRVVLWEKNATEGILVAGGNGEGSELDQLKSPSGLWLDAAGNIYISDQGNHRVVKWLK